MSSEAVDLVEDDSPPPEPRPEPRLHLGDVAPDIELKAGPRKKAALASYWQERPLALVFLPALASQLAIEVAVQWRDGGSPVEEAGGAIVAVCNASPLEAAAFRERWRLGYPLLSDPTGDAYEALDVTPELPGCFVIDTAGALRYAHRNEAPLDSPPTWALADAVGEITGKQLERPVPQELPPIDAPLVGVVPLAQAATAVFTCGKCGHHDYDILDVSTASGFLSRLFNFQNRRFSAVVCRQCRYAELYQSESGKLRNAIDLLFGS